MFKTFLFRLVNGNPDGKRSQNVFKHQFSCDQQDLLLVYVSLLLVYAILTPVQMYASMQQRHPISRLLAAGLSTQFIALLLINVHFSLFAANGVGIVVFHLC